MLHLHLSPVSLFALILSLTAQIKADLVSPYDPFHDISKLKQRPPEPPICCLKPLEPLEPVNTPADEILSFEEWKAKQVHAQKGPQRQGDGQTHKKHSEASQEAQVDAENASDIVSGADAGSQQSQHQQVVSPPQLVVPLTGRYNYASLDCSARVHAAHRSAKSTASLLSSKKDRYMLSPCATPGEDQFVVVELCEDIHIDTVQLANFEFFSGVFKDFTVSVAKTLPANPDGWTHAGTYRAKNIRGVQSFHLPSTLRDFYRLIRIEFHSHYGNEYYCPVSLLRVYGLTHLEQWKREEWEAEFQKMKEEAGRIAGQVHDTTESSSLHGKLSNTKETSSGTTMKLEDATPSIKGLSELLSELSDTPTPSSAATSNDSSQTDSSETTLSRDSSITNAKHSEDEHAQDSSTNSRITEKSHMETSETASMTSHGTSSASDDSSKDDSESTSQDTARTNQPYSPSPGVSILPTIIPQEAKNVPALSSSGESIFRTIMTRLTALETNSTLVLRYVEEQTRSLRDALRKLEEDVGRLEGLGKLQAQTIQKTANEWDRQRRRLEREHYELLARVDFLTDEVILEKRLGIAQLCLLLIVLVFMALTRGSRGEPVAPAKIALPHDGIKEWGRRHLSSLSSVDWAAKLRNRSRTPRSVSMERSDHQGSGERTPQANEPALLSSSSSARLRSPAAIHAPHPRQFISRRPVTPTSSFFGLSPSYRPALNTLIYTSGGASPGRPRLRRMNSHNSPVAITHTLSTGVAPPSSAKKFAKTAHLHEIRRVKSKSSGSMRRAPGHERKDSSASENIIYMPDILDPKDGGLTRVDKSLNSVDGSDPEGDRDRDSLNHTREPLSVLPIQNRTRSPQHIKNGLSSPYIDSEAKIVDLDADSENGWVDTDIEGSETGGERNT